MMKTEMTIRTWATKRNEFADPVNLEREIEHWIRSKKDRKVRQFINKDNYN